MLGLKLNHVSKRGHWKQGFIQGDQGKVIEGQPALARTGIFVREFWDTGGSTARDLQADLSRTTGVRVSDQIVRNRIHEAGLRARRRCRAIPLTAAHCASHRQFAQYHLNWQLRHWRLGLFTDESRYTLSLCDERGRTWGGVEERYRAENIAEHDICGGRSVMVWGGISLDGHTDLYVLHGGTLAAVRYRDDILRLIVRPYGPLTR